MTSTMERLSTGLRINSAKDDAAGLAISSKMTSQIRGLDQAVRNANDAISMIQVAEGAMKEVTNMFQRMRELAVQSISDSNTNADRGALNNEYKQLSAEVARIAENTQWNGTNILDGARTNSVFQIGANASQTIAVNFGDLSTNNVTTTVNSGNAIASGGLDAVTVKLSAAPSAGDVLSYKVTSINADGTSATNYATISLDDYAAATGNVGTGALAVETTSAGAAATEVATSQYTLGTTTITIDKVSTTGGDKITISDVQLTRGTHAPVAATDITTRAFSTTALDVLDKAIEGVNSTRATLGASMSRLEYAADNLQNVSQNSSAARSRVLDADYASETTELARTQIIQQASTAMLSQANQAQQSVLSLLK
jgi:flagellin